MSNSGEQLPELPPDPVPRDPVAAIASLGVGEVLQIEDDVLNTRENREHSPVSWLQVVKDERVRRVRALETLRTHIPKTPESLAYDAEQGPEGYIAKIRQMNLASAGRNLMTGKLFQAEKERLDELAQRFIGQNRARLSDTAKQMTRLELQDFLALNLRGILLTPRVIARHAYEDRKREVIRNHIPHAPLQNATVFLDEAKAANVKTADVQEAKEEVLAVPYSTPIADFFQLTPDQQNSIVHTLGDEWLTMCETAYNINPKLLKVRNNLFQAPLAYHSVAELEQILERDQLAAQIEACKVFLRHPLVLEPALQEANKIAAERATLQAFYEAQRRQRPAKVEIDAVNENLTEIQRLLDDPDVREEVLDIEMGETIALTEPDKRIPTTKVFDTIIDKHIQLIGRAMWANMVDRSPRGVNLDEWGKFNVGEAFRGSHYGALRNLKITRMPVSQEEFDNLTFAGRGITLLRENMVRLIFEVEMKHTGKRGEPAFLTMLLWVRRREATRDEIFKPKTGTRSSGLDVAMSLHLESVANAWRATGRNLRSPPLRVGLPGVSRKGPHSARRG